MNFTSITNECDNHGISSGQRLMLPTTTRSSLKLEVHLYRLYGCAIC